MNRLADVQVPIIPPDLKIIFFKIKSIIDLSDLKLKQILKL